MKIGLIDVDGHNGYPNLALMKISSRMKLDGHDVEWAKPINLFDQVHYDIIFASKVFSFTKDVDEKKYIADNWIKGGTGYNIYTNLEDDVESSIPDYDIYNLPKNVAYGFLTRGCPNSCYWCVVPNKEGKIHRNCDIEDLAVNGRNKVILMDNNVLAHQHGIEQLEKISKMDVWVDFNQGLDARLVTYEIADILARVKWIKNIRFGCDTPKQVKECYNATEMLRSMGCRKNFLFYTMLHGDINECYERLMFWHNMGNSYNVQAQPYININSTIQNIPQWQKDMAHWGNQKVAFHTCDFKEFSPRKGFKCSAYFK